MVARISRVHHSDASASHVLYTLHEKFKCLLDLALSVPVCLAVSTVFAPDISKRMDTSCRESLYIVAKTCDMSQLCLQALKR